MDFRGPRFDRWPSWGSDFMRGWDREDWGEVDVDWRQYAGTSDYYDIISHYRDQSFFKVPSSRVSLPEDVMVDEFLQMEEAFGTRPTDQAPEEGKTGTEADIGYDKQRKTGGFLWTSGISDMAQ